MYMSRKWGNRVDKSSRVHKYDKDRRGYIDHSKRKDHRGIGYMSWVIRYRTNKSHHILPSSANTSSGKLEGTYVGMSHYARQSLAGERILAHMFSHIDQIRGGSHLDTPNMTESNKRTSRKGWSMQYIPQDRLLESAA